jgi:prepilin-type N-terminal cleavage/methylation domain-containing protein
MGRIKIHPRNSEHGFSLIEILMATALATVGLLAAFQLLLVAAGSATLARAQGAAVLSAMNKLESLSDSYSRDPSNGNVLPGNHGPETVRVINPNGGGVLNCFQITWTVDGVADPRPGKALDARRVRITVTPASAGGTVNYHPPFNKILNVTTVFSPRMR